MNCALGIWQHTKRTALFCPAEPRASLYPEVTQYHDKAKVSAVVWSAQAHIWNYENILFVEEEELKTLWLLLCWLAEFTIINIHTCIHTYISDDPFNNTHQDNEKSPVKEHATVLQWGAALQLSSTPQMCYDTSSHMLTFTRACSEQVRCAWMHKDTLMRESKSRPCA